ncbi:hypothetical protein PSTT_15840, partial [Puccinia striiformis]
MHLQLTLLDDRGPEPVAEVFNHREACLVLVNRLLPYSSGFSPSSSQASIRLAMDMNFGSEKDYVFVPVVSDSDSGGGHSDSNSAADTKPDFVNATTEPNQGPGPHGSGPQDGALRKGGFSEAELERFCEEFMTIGLFEGALTPRQLDQIIDKLSATYGFSYPLGMHHVQGPDGPIPASYTIHTTLQEWFRVRAGHSDSLLPDFVASRSIGFGGNNDEGDAVMEARSSDSSGQGVRQLLPLATALYLEYSGGSTSSRSKLTIKMRDLLIKYGTIFKESTPQIHYSQPFECGANGKIFDTTFDMVKYSAEMEVLLAEMNSICLDVSRKIIGCG